MRALSHRLEEADLVAIAHGPHRSASIEERHDWAEAAYLTVPSEPNSYASSPILQESGLHTVCGAWADTKMAVHLSRPPRIGKYHRASSLLRFCLSATVPGAFSSAERTE